MTARLRVGDVVDGVVINGKRWHQVARTVEAYSDASPGLAICFRANGAARPTGRDLPRAAELWREKAVACRVSASRAARTCNRDLHRVAADRCDRRARMIERVVARSGNGGAG